MNSQLQMYTIKAPWSDGYMDYISSHQDLLEMVTLLVLMYQGDLYTDTIEVLSVEFVTPEKRTSNKTINISYKERGDDYIYTESWSAYPLKTLSELKGEL